MASRRSPTPTVDGRLSRSEPRLGPRLWLAAGLGIAAASCTMATAILLAAVVSRVFLGHADLASVVPLLAVAFGLVLVRAGCLISQEVVAQRAVCGPHFGRP
jgi:hypothetical protein